MTDVLTKRQRSYNMSRIKHKDTRPELVLRKQLWMAGIKNYRLSSRLPGRPDLVFHKARLVVFVDGCFWHMCPACFKEPCTRKEFWQNKLRANVERDRCKNEELDNLGWTVLRVWEHEIRQNPELVRDKVVSILKNLKK